MNIINTVFLWTLTRKTSEIFYQNLFTVPHFDFINGAYFNPSDFQHLKDTFPQPPGTDLSPDIMNFKYHFSLAQAQECILEKSMTDNRKATINGIPSSKILFFCNMLMKFRPYVECFLDANFQLLLYVYS